MRYHETIIYITCKECEKEFDENKITDPNIDIEENERGWDVLSFICPYCNKHTTSLRRG
jgi:hypothetical protein